MSSRDAVQLCDLKTLYVGLRYTLTFGSLGTWAHPIAADAKPNADSSANVFSFARCGKLADPSARVGGWPLALSAQGNPW
jgi:hypothetical protein